MSFLCSTLRLGKISLQPFGRRFSVDAVKPAADAVKEDRASWYILSGFSRAVHRLDLDSVLGDVRPLKVEPLLDSKFFTSGHYALQLRSDQHDSLKAQLLENYKHKFKLQKDGNEYRNYYRYSEFKIDSRTVRIRGYRNNIPPKQLYYLYNNFNLRRREPVRVIKVGEQILCFLHFLTPQDAERFAAEKGHDKIDDREVAAFHYHA